MSKEEEIIIGVEGGRDNDGAIPRPQKVLQDKSSINVTTTS
jgi:hypothetical protein